MFNPEPDRIVMVGLGGGSLAKFCHRHLPRSQVEALEINPAVALRGDFMVPPDDERFRVIACDAAEFLGGASDHADVILLDGFGDQGMPDALCSEAFYADCLRALRDDGLLVINFHVNHPLYHEYLRVRESFGAAMFEVVDDDMTNSIVFACKGDLLDDPASARLRRPEALSKDAWRQLMPTLRVIGATLTLRRRAHRRPAREVGPTARLRLAVAATRPVAISDYSHFRIPWRSLEWASGCASRGANRQGLDS